MIRHILIPLDGSEHSDRLLLDVRRLLLGLEDVEVHLLEVVEISSRSPAGWVNDLDPTPGPIQLQMEDARRHLNRVAGELENEGVKVGRKVLTGDPTREILRAIESLHPDLLAMATHGRSGFSRWVRGSVAERVLRRAPVPVLLCNPDREAEHAQCTRFRRVLVTLDGSETASRILPMAQAVARQYDAEILLLRVVGLPIAFAADAGSVRPPAGLLTPEEGAETLRPYQRRIESAGLSARVVTAMGEAATEILRVIDDEDIDLLAMTTHGHSGVDRWLFGSVAENVLRRCPIPLLVLRVAGGTALGDNVPDPAPRPEGRE